MSASSVVRVLENAILLVRSSRGLPPPTNVEDRSSWEQSTLAIRVDMAYSLSISVPEENHSAARPLASLTSV